MDAIVVSIATRSGLMTPGLLTMHDFEEGNNWIRELVRRYTEKKKLILGAGERDIPEKKSDQRWT
jgi:hypothetical protein